MDEPLLVKPPKGLALLSDLHTEHGMDRPLRAIRSLAKKNPELKVLALVGDLGNWSACSRQPYFDKQNWSFLQDFDKPKSQLSSFPTLIRKISEEFSYKLLVVPGNHDYYFCGATQALTGDEDPAEFFAMADGCMEDMVEEHGGMFLQKKVVAVDKAVIAGTTLWSPALSASKESIEYMNDYVAIDGFTPAICQAVYEDQAAWLKAMTTDPEIAPSIVLTHHPPLDHPKLHHREYTSESAPLFHADLYPLFNDPAFCPPRFWGFGHTHVRKAVYVGKTLLMANALGDPFSDRLWDLPSLTTPLFTCKR